MTRTFHTRYREGLGSRAVAQSCTLPYRRFGIGRALKCSNALEQSVVRRMQFCATAECNSALRGRELSGLTRIEVLVIVGVLLVLVVLSLPLLPSARDSGKYRRIKCVNNLKNVSISFRIFAIDHGQRFPWQLSREEGGTKEDADESSRIWRHFAVMSNELSTPKILFCPADEAGLKRKEANAWSNSSSNPPAAKLTYFESNRNLSYFVGARADSSNPVGWLAGDRNITNPPPERLEYGLARIGILGTNTTTAGWDHHIHRNAGNIVSDDGTVQQMTNLRLRETLRSAGSNKIRIAVPD
jgi:hypothetical protein